MYLRNILIIFTALSLSGCAVVSLETTNNEHKKIYGLDCSGWLNSKNQCYEKAHKLCPNGFTVLSNDAPMAPLGVEVAYSMPGVKKELTVQCK